jgi:hypothetical protein
MIASDSLVGADRPILETIGFLRLGEGLDIIARRFLMALERGNAISLSSMIFCAMALTAQGVNRCDRAPDRHDVGQRGVGQDLLRLFTGLDLPRYAGRWRAAKAATL